MLGPILAVLASFDRRDGGRRRARMVGRRSTPITDATIPQSGGDDLASGGDDLASPDDDLALAQRFARAEPDAIRQLYVRFGRPVFTVTYSVLRDRALAAEAVQMTFLKAWRAADRYDPARPLAPWLYSIARRTAIDVARSERRHVSTELRDTDATDTPPMMERAWEAWQVRRAVDQLSRDEREIVRLQHFERLTHQEIATRLNTKIGTVKSRSYRAHKRLAEALRHLREEDVA